MLQHPEMYRQSNKLYTAPLSESSSCPTMLDDNWLLNKYLLDGKKYYRTPLSKQSSCYLQIYNYSESSILQLNVFFLSSSDQDSPV